jgi:glycerol uptake facilitator-like aquaporin
MSFLITLSRYAIREPAAEFLGTMIFVIFGTGVNCSVFLSVDPNVEAVPRGVSRCYQRLIFTIQAQGEIQYRISFRSILAGLQVG